MQSDRSVDEVLSTAKLAGLKLKPNAGPVQVLKFSPALNSVDYRLVELPPQLQDALQTGEKVVFRGDEQDEAVLCSQTETHEMKVVDLSNTMLLCPRLSTPEDGSFKLQSPEDAVERLDVCASVSSYYELRPCRPRLTKLKQMLKLTAYRGPEAENDHVKLYSLEDLLGSVQASEDELLTALQHLGAFETNGKWRVLDIQYEEAVFLSILNLLDEKMWSYESVPLLECYALLEELYPSFVIKHCLEVYGNKCLGEGGKDGHYCLDAVRVCQFYAEYLLRAAGRFNFDEFIDSWQQSVPSGMKTTLDQLKGVALWDLDTRPRVIWSFSVNDLPEDPPARFAKLFETRSKWTLEEIEPFINDLSTEKISSNALLLKYARMSTDSSGQRVFNSKRPV